MNKRLNNFEALRILAMFMVIVLHYLDKGRLLTSATAEFNCISYAAWLVEAFAIVAVNVYVLITGYFMCESNMKPKRLIQIVCQVLWYTILIPVVLAALGVVEFGSFDTYDWLRFVFPVHMKHYWFVTAYVILMLLVPFLNAGIQQMSQKQLAFSTILLTVYQSLPKSVLPVKFTDDEAGNHVLWLVCLYLIAAYIRKYGIPFFSSLKKSLLCYVSGALCVFASLLVMRVVYFNLDAFGESLNFGYHYNHILCLFASVSLFYVFKHWEFKDGAISRLVGKAASYTFGVYLIHEHILVRSLWPQWLHVVPTENIGVFLFSLIWKVSLVLIVGLMLDWLRALVFKGRMKDLLFYGAIAFLILYTFRKVNQGIDVTDTGYHFSNFMYMSEMDPMWIFSTYLASVLGHFFTILPGGDTLLGINIYTSIIPALLGVMTFVFFVKVVKLKVWESFLGVLVALALCWCPTTCVYNYLTYFFFCAGAILLYMGLTKDSPWLLIGAGICLGVNVLVRFPNAAEAALIVVVWYTCFLRREKFLQYVQKTGWCLLGYLVGMGIVFVQIGLQYGIGEYVNGIIRLLGMTSDASDYTLYSMIYNLIQAYLFSGKWVLIMAVCVLLGLFGFMVFPGKLTGLKGIGYAACCVVLVRWFYGQGMFSLAYDGYGAILNWGAVVIIGVLLFALWQVISPKSTEAEKIFSVIVIIVIGITPLGSNNQLYANLNNMFLVVPYVIHVLVKLFSGNKESVLKVKNHTLTISKWPLILMTFTCVIMLFVQSLLFGQEFIFRDSVPRNSKVNSIMTVKGMSTNETNAKNLEELGEYALKAGLKGRNVLLFGDVPGLSAYLNMPFVMSPWPDLPSYSNATFEAELEQVLTKIDKKRPVIILGADFYEFLTNQLEDIGVNNMYEAKYGYKIALLRDMIETYDYNCTFANEAYVIYE